MRTVQDYISEARKKQNIYSNNKLALKLGITNGAISAIFKGKSLPAEETIIKLAELAEIPPEQALLDLACWKASSPKSKEIWDKLRKLVLTLCAATVLFCNFAIGGGNFAAPERK